MTTRERITRQDVLDYKREILDQTVLVAAPEAASMLACSETKIQRLVREGRIHAYGSPGVKGLRFLASELRDYVRSLKIDREKWRE